MSLELDDYLVGSQFAGYRIFWRQQFDLSKETFRLASAFLFEKGSAPSITSHSMVVLDDIAQSTVQRISRRTHQGRFVVIAAAFSALLARLTSKDTITLGLPPGAALPNSERPLLCIPIQHDKPIRDLLSYVSGAVPACEANRNFPVGAFARALGLEVGTDVSIVSEAIHGQAEGDPSHCLALVIREANPVNVTLSSPNGSVPAWFLTMLGDLLNETLKTFAHPDWLQRSVQEAIDSRSLDNLSTFNCTKKDFEAGWVTHDGDASNTTRRATVVDIFERQVLAHPDATALICDDELFSYAELDEQATRLAHSLTTRLGVAPGTVVASLNTRSHWAIISLLAIFKAGAAFLPLNPNLPEQGIARILSESSAGAIISHSNYLNLLNGSEEIPLYAIDIQLPNAPAPAASVLHSPIARAESIAYIVYTSGSTGQSKGVMIAHQGLTNTVLEHIERFAITPDDRYLQFMAISFDGFLLDTFSALCAGAALVIADDITIADPVSFMSYGERHRTTISTITPSYLKLLDPQRLSCLRVLVSAGEAISHSLVRDYASRLALFNGYGPSEATINSTLHRIAPTSTVASGVIGGPSANKEIFVVNEQLQPQPIGIVGEICIAGEGLALGYLADQSLTDEKFIECPFGNGRMYLSGDFGAWTPDGTLLFKGRSDSQLKINGLRVDVAEIDQAIQALPGLQAAHVIPRQSNDGRTDICAFYELKPKMELVPSLGEYGIYDVFLYESMATDKVRVDGYRRALARRVAGKVVLDPGTGSELVLARHCIDAGAARVYAFEIDEDAFSAAQNNIRRYRLDGKIVLIKGDVTLSRVLPEPVDVVVSALAGNVASADGCLCIMNEIKRTLASPVSFIPNRYVTRIAGFDLSEPHLKPGFSEISVHYFDALFRKYQRPFDARLCVQNLQRDFILTETGCAETIDYREELHTDSVTELHLKVLKAGQLSGFILWLNAFCDDDLMIDSAEKTHHLPVYLPIYADTNLTVAVGDLVSFRFIRSLGVDGVHPDYRIEGVLQSEHSIDRQFHCESLHAPQVFRHLEIYKRLFSQDGTAAARVEITQKVLREALQQQLPPYMVPHRLVEVTEWPRTIHGKIDARALLDLVTASDLNKDNYAPAEGPLEAVLCQIWCEVLDQQKIGVDDNFFSLGCDSIRVIQAVHLAREQGIRVKASDVMIYQTVRSLAAHIQMQLEQGEHARSDRRNMPEMGIQIELASITVDESSVLPPDVLDAYPASAMQLTMLEHYEQDHDLNGIYHCCAVWHFADETLSEEALIAALQHLYDAHASLRTFFVNTPSGRCLQAIRRTHDLAIPLENARIANDDGFFREQIQADIAERFDPHSSADPLVRFKLWRTSTSTCSLLISFHHAILDGWSGVELRNTLVDYYVMFKDGVVPPLPNTQADSRKEFIAIELDACRQSKALAYWNGQFEKGAIHFNLLPAWLDSRQGANDNISGFATLAKPIPSEVIIAAEESAKLLGISMKAVFLSAFAQSFAQVFSASKFLIGVVVNGRSEQLSSPLSTTGLFWNIVPISVDASNDTTAYGLQKTLHAAESVGPYPLREIENRVIGKSLFLPTFNFVNFHNRKTHAGVQCHEGLVNDRFHFPLNLFVAAPSSEESYSGLWRAEFDKKHFSIECVENLISHCNKLILSMTAATY